MRSRRPFLIAALTVALLGAPRVADAVEDVPQATLTVTGQGVVKRAPDLATVAVTIVTNDPNAGRALSENNRRYAALIAKLAVAGINASAIESTSLQSYFNPRPGGAAGNEAGQQYGFIVNRSVGITVGDLGRTGAVIDDATAAGATQINGVAYGFHDRRAVERAALAAAVGDAAAQAQAMAGAARVQIVRILRIGNELAPARELPMAMSMARAAESVPTTITPSDLEVARSVTITYLIR